MTKKQNHDLHDRLHEMEADLRYNAAITSALSDRARSFADRLASEGLDSNSIRTLPQEVITLQEALSRALTGLNNAAVAEYEARG